MARFVYQPVPSNMENYSKHGQLIADIYSGHISTNHNNVIISSTKRIENKIEDVFQIESNIIEQKNVINNLRDDLYSIIDHKYADMYDNFRKVQINCGVTKGVVSYIKRGIGAPGMTELCILEQLVDAIYNIRKGYTEAREKQALLIMNINNTFTGGGTLFGGKSLSKYIESLKDEIATQQVNIELARTNVEAKLKMYMYYDY